MQLVYEKLNQVLPSLNGILMQLITLSNRPFEKQFPISIKNYHIIQSMYSYLYSYFIHPFDQEISTMIINQSINQSINQLTTTQFITF